MSASVGDFAGVQERMSAPTKHACANGHPQQQRGECAWQRVSWRCSSRMLTAMLLVVALAVCPRRAIADSTGERAATATAALVGGGFANAANAFACNDTLTATGSANNQAQTYSVYGVSLPVTLPAPVVTGIQVHVRARNDGSAKNRKVRVSLSWNGGANFTDILTGGQLQTRNLRSTLRDYFLGGPTYLWGRPAWTPAEVSDGNFQVKIVARNLNPTNGGNIQLDCIPVTVFYQIPGAPVLSVSKTASPDPVQPGQNLTYTITYGNTGASTATNVVVTDTLQAIPPNATFVSASPAPFSAPSVGSTGTVTWHLGSLAVGQTGALTLVVQVAANLADGTQILNDAYDIRSDQNPTPTAGNPVTTTVVGTILLSVSKSDSPDPVAPGGTLTYVLTITNSGTSPSTNIDVSEGYDPNVAYVSYMSSGCGSVSGGGAPDFTWTIASLLAGPPCTITVTTTVHSPLADGTLLFNVVDISDQGGSSASASTVTTVHQCAGQSNGSPCNDVNACTQTDTCQNGSCVGSNPVLCTALNQCHDAGTCNPDTGVCSNPIKVDGTPCADDDACTGADACSGGSCVGGAPPNCNDNNGCTDDGCNPASGCTHVDNNDPCDDDDACTTTDACSGGSCVGGAPPNCNDNNVCTDDDCDPGSGCVHSDNTAPCDDGNACSTGDTCGESNCGGGGPTNCDDGNVCTLDSCTVPTGCTHAPVGGCCNVNADCTDTDQCTTNERCENHACVSDAVVCSDSNGCTDDSCNPGSGCTYVPNNDPCDDGDACTSDDTCSAGSCVGGSAPNCNDNNVCTDDTCNSNSGCVHANNTAPCDDSDACTSNDICGGGTCGGGGATNCDDGNGCTDDGCNPAGGCTHVNNNAPCDDDNACTTADACTSGSCAGGPPPNCADGNVCTDDDCNPSSGCVHSDNSALCDDHDACTSNDICGGGICGGGGPTDCDDGNACTNDSCPGPTGCTHTPVGGCCNVDADCTDTDQCTTNEHCDNHNCLSDAVVCNDNNGCTDDSCNPGSGCVYVANNTSCDDADACTTGDACSEGGCSGGPPPSCNDNNVCTNDGCNSPSGCASVNNTAACDDGDNCTTGDTCGGGACVGGPAPSCDDSNGCTNDTCSSPSGTCLHSPNTAPCDDGNVCTVNDTCANSVCQGASTECGDGNLQAACGENCDDGNTAEGDGCSDMCRLEPCGPAPVESCTEAFSRKSILVLKDKVPDDDDRLIWKWKGAEADKANFGDPTASSNYQFCIYRETAPRLMLSAAASAGGTCPSRPCWAARGKGFKYKDKELTPDGLGKIVLRAAQPEGKVLVKGKGLNLQMPTLTLLDSTVTVQLKDMNTGKCWEAVYNSPAIKSTAQTFKDKTD